MSFLNSSSLPYMLGGSPPDESFPDSPELSWWNVAFASCFLLVNGIISVYMGLGLEKTLFVAAVRCLVQLTAMGYLLTEIFDSQHPVTIIGMASLLVLLATIELVFHRAKYVFQGIFMTIFCSLYFSTMLIGSVGGMLALETKPFYDPVVFIPTVGMLIGNCMSSVGVGLSAALNQLCEHSDLVEQRLSFGATRWEAAKPVAVEAIKLALLPTINSLSIIGLITIPGMMTGQILGGTPILVAVKYQQIIMFLITASSTLGTVGAVITCIFLCLDSSHMLRKDKIKNVKPIKVKSPRSSSGGPHTQRSRPVSVSHSPSHFPASPTPPERRHLLGP